METLIDALNSQVAHALGWTLIHSLWQGLLCFLLGVLLLRLIPSERSVARYNVSVAVLALMVVCSAITFAVVFGPGTERVVAGGSAAYVQSVADAPVRGGSSAPFDLFEADGTFDLFEADGTLFFDLFEADGTLFAGDGPFNLFARRGPFDLFAGNTTVDLLIRNNIGFLVALWLAGATLFLLRFLGGYWYMGFIRQSAEPIGRVWEERVAALAEKLNITGSVEVAQTAILHAPVVLGYFRPLILVPVGMFSGLTTDQLEAIFVHELMHIKRGDYLVNLAQGFVEAIFFFNPFAWLMSSAIRREREHCCDDAVVASQGNALAYVRALATLEESKLLRTGFAPSLAGEKNQLLNRIKRIMEKSVHRYSGRDRIAPAVLLLIGLTCASWLTIQSGDRDKLNHDTFDQDTPMAADGRISAPDTIVHPNEDSYYRYTIKTIDADGKQSIRVIEGYGDERELRETIAGVEPLFPPRASDSFESVDPFLAIPPSVGVAPFIDAAPFIDVAHFIDAAHFIDVAPFIAMDSLFRVDPFLDGAELFMGAEPLIPPHPFFGTEPFMGVEPLIAPHPFMGTEPFTSDLDAIPGIAPVPPVGAAEERMGMAAMELARTHAHLNALHQMESSEFARDMAEFEQAVKRVERTFHDAQEHIREAAVKDGYLKKDESIRTIDMNDDGMTINGKKVKPADEKRYRELMRAPDK